MRDTPSTRSLRVAAAALFCSLPTIQHAQTDNTDENLVLAYTEVISDGVERIKAVNQLRTLSQQVTAAACVVTSGVDVENAAQVLQTSYEMFDGYLVALRDGDPTIGIELAEENAKILQDLDEIEAEWSRVSAAVTAILADNTDVESFQYIDDRNLALLDLTTKLMTDTVAEYGQNFQLTARDAALVEISGRQLLLTQKMAKDACEIWTGYNAEAAAADMRDTMGIFENSLNALRFGLPAAGVIAAPTEEIGADLDKILARWNEIKVNQQALLDGQTLTVEQKTALFRDWQTELVDLGVLVQRYREYAERSL